MCHVRCNNINTAVVCEGSALTTTVGCALQAERLASELAAQAEAVSVGSASPAFVAGGAASTGAPYKWLGGFVMGPAHAWDLQRASQL